MGFLKLEVTYADGKFKMIVEASVCLGVGARGKLACEANAVLIYEFTVWFYYQLYRANFEFLVFVHKNAFLAFQQIQFLAIQTGKKAGHFMFDTQEQLDLELDRVLGRLEESEVRNKLAQRILSDAMELRHTTPETKGMLLYQLTRHAKTDWADPGNYSRADAFNDRKRAVLEILRWVQTLKEWENVLQRVDARGRKTPENSRAHLLRFLQLGYVDMHDELTLLEMRLRIDPFLHHAVFANDTADYQIFETDSRRFATYDIEPLSTVDFSNNV